MYHDNPEMHTTYEVVFDFLKPTNEAQKYTYYIYNKIFTFTIDFTNNDPKFNPTSLIPKLVRVDDDAILGIFLRDQCYC